MWVSLKFSLNLDTILWVKTTFNLHQNFQVEAGDALELEQTAEKRSQSRQFEADSF